MNKIRNEIVLHNKYLASILFYLISKICNICNTYFKYRSYTHTPTKTEK